VNNASNPRATRWPWLAPGVLLIVGGLLFPTAGRDDKFITYWPAWTLAEWGEIVNYNGDRIEQSSSLLHVFLIAGATWISNLPPPVTGWTISVLVGVFGVWLTQRVAERCVPGMGLAAALIVAVGAPYAYWSFSGMETPVVAASALGMLLAVTWLSETTPTPRALACAAGPILAYLLVRPESPMVLFCVIAGLAALTIVRRMLPHLQATDSNESPLAAPQVWIPVALLALALAAVVAGLRIAYFDSPLPQPVYAKSADLSLLTIKKGITYLTREGAHWLLIPLAFLGALRVLVEGLRGSASSLRIGIACFFGAYTSFIVLTGGGWMEATRFAGHLYPALAILCIEALTWLPRPGLRPMLAGAVVLVALAGSIRIAQVHSSSMPLWAILASDGPEDPRHPWIVRYNLSNRRDIEMTDAASDVLSRLIAERDEKVPLLAYNTGMVMYGLAMQHYGEFTSIDLHGLSDRYITRSSQNDSIRRFALGLKWNIVDFLRLQPELQAETGVEAPLLIFCAAWPMDARGVAWVEAEDFSLAYWQLRDFDAGTNFLAGRGVEASQILAVRNTHASALEGMPPVQVPEAPSATSE
jgi:hypothetical protein